MDQVRNHIPPLGGPCGSVAVLFIFGLIESTLLPLKVEKLNFQFIFGLIESTLLRLKVDS